MRDGDFVDSKPAKHPMREASVRRMLFNTRLSIDKMGKCVQ